MIYVVRNYERVCLNDISSGKVEDPLLKLNSQSISSTNEEILKNLLQTNGKEILKEKQRLCAMISDLFHNDTQIIRLLRLSIQEEVPLKLSELFLLKSPDLLIKISALKSQVKEKTFCEDEALDKMFQLWSIALNPPKKLSVKVEPEDGEWIDEFGAIYSADRSKIIKGPKEKEYYNIIEGTQVVCDDAFRCCFSLREIVIPNSVKLIGENAFSYTELKKITIPESVSDLHFDAFLCNELEAIEVNESSRLFTSVDGIIFKKNLKTIIRCPSGKIFEGGTFTIPDSVTTIWISAFSNCKKLQKIIIPDSVKFIEDLAFEYCENLKSISLPHSVIFIHECVFISCHNLETIEVNKSNKNFASIDGVLFNHILTTLICCPAGKLFEENMYKLPDYVTSIKQAAFWGCSNLQNILIPGSLTSIGQAAFWGCSNLQSITIPDSVTSIGAYAFGYCSNLQSIAIPNSVTSIGESAFIDCYNLQSITIPSSLIKAFLGHNVSENSITDHLQDFITEFFPNCDNLNQIIIISSDDSSETKQIWFEEEERTIDIFIKAQ